MKCTRNTRVLLILCVLMTGMCTVFAQKGALPGYVVTLQNDTLRGTLADKGGFANSTSVGFTDGRTGQAREYLPGDIAGYTIEPDQAYVSQDLSGSFVGKQVFARRVVKGYASLYTTVPQAGSPVYIVEKSGQPPLPLAQRTYFGLLKYTFSDCAALKFETSARKVMSYSEKSLQNVVSRYNECITPGQTQTSHRRKVKINYGVAAGFGMNHYNYVFGEERYGPRGDYGWRGTPLLGVFAGVRLGQKLELEGQLLYGQYQGSYTKRHTNGVYGDQPFRFRFSYLQASLLPRYYVWNNLYLTAGPHFNIRLRQSGTQTFMGRTEPFEGHPTGLSPGAAVGAGVKLRVLQRISLVEGRLSSNRVLDGVTNLASFTSVQVLLRTNLNK
jgi:hypothetical protein